MYKSLMKSTKTEGDLDGKQINKSDQQSILIDKAAELLTTSLIGNI